MDTSKTGGMDTSKEGCGRGSAILQEAAAYYAAMEPYRRERQRNKRYHYGNQWDDLIEVDGRHITEDEYIRQQGSVPLKNNLIRRLVRNVIGVYNSQTSEPVCVACDAAEAPMAEAMTEMLRYNMQLNRLSALYTRTMEEFLIGGLVVHRKSYGERNGRTDCWTDFVQPNCFFIDNHMRDFRGWDCTCVGEVHDIDYGTLLTRFARSADDAAQLRALYGEGGIATGGGPFPAGERGQCRVVEVWRKEVRSVAACHDTATGRLRAAGGIDICAANSQRRRRGMAPLKERWSCRQVWRYYFLAPNGAILAEGDTPYTHGEHPYVVKAYPMIDGEIHSFVNDVIDQQRYTNRLITLYDWIMRSSAKGVLLVPDDCVPPGVHPDEFAEAWSRFNGVIVYKPSAQGAVPQQVSANSTDIGIRDLLNLQLQFFEDISGVNGAIQGKTSNVAMSAELYGQQTQNATTTLLDLLDTFSEFVRDAAYKDVKNMQQYYTAEHYLRAIGRLPYPGGKDGDGKKRVGKDGMPGDFADAEFDLRITPRTNTPAMRQTTNAQLMEIWKSGQITLEQMLRAGHFPFADRLL